MRHSRRAGAGESFAPRRPLNCRQKGALQNVTPQVIPWNFTLTLLLKGLAREKFRRRVPCFVVLLWKTP
jgi:hypothetical protein